MLEIACVAGKIVCDINADVGFSWSLFAWMKDHELDVAQVLVFQTIFDGVQCSRFFAFAGKGEE